MSASTPASAAHSGGVLRPRTTTEAVAALADADRTVIAGGTDVMVAVRSGTRSPTGWLDVTRLDELHGWRHDEAGHILGAATTVAACLRTPGLPAALRAACRALGSAPVRSRATVGGNVVTASPAGDLLPFLVAADAVARVEGAAGGVREVPVVDLVGAGRQPLRPDELLVDLRWSAGDGPGRWGRVSLRAAVTPAVASCCTLLDPADRTIRVALGGVAPGVVRARAVEREAAVALERAGWWDDPGAPVAERDLREVAGLVADAIDPITDIRASVAYRRHVAAVLVRRHLRSLTGPDAVGGHP